MSLETDALKKVYANRPQTTLITDLSAAVIWASRELPDYMKGVSLPELFKTADNGCNYFKINSTTYCFRLMFCPDIDNGIIIAELPEQSCSDELTSNPVFKSFHARHDALLRQIIFGIVNCTELLNTALIDNDMYNDLDYLNITVGNCRRLLKTQMNVSELIKLSDKSMHSVAIVDLSKTVAEFCDILQDMLRNKFITFNRNIQPDVYISIDADRLTSCLLCVFLLAYGKDAAQNYIEFSVQRSGESAVFSINVQSQGIKTRAPEIPEDFSPFCEYGEGSELESEENLLRRFCDTFNASFISYKNEETKSYTITFA